MKPPEQGHWYTPQGEAKHWVEKKDGSGNRPTTIADARKLGLLPSVTTVLNALAKPALTKWLIDTAVNAVLTTPRQPGEDLDAFKARALTVDAEEEASKARDLGTDIHQAIEDGCAGKQVPDDLLRVAKPALDFIRSLGEIVASEIVLVGEGYAGKCDLIVRSKDGLGVTDVKSCKKLPKSSWPDHRLQTAAYAAAYQTAAVAWTGNLYVCTSTDALGQFVFDLQTDWLDTYENGFVPLLKTWMWMNNFRTNQNQNANERTQ